MAFKVKQILGSIVFGIFIGAIVILSISKHRVTRAFENAQATERSLRTELLSAQSTVDGLRAEVEGLEKTVLDLRIDVGDAEKRVVRLIHDNKQLNRKLQEIGETNIGLESDYSGIRDTVRDGEQLLEEFGDTIDRAISLFEQG